jgi:hypothetical protein
MATLNNKLTIDQHNTRSIGCVVIGVSDISGYIPYLTVKKNNADSSTILSIVGTVTDASGTMLFNLSSTDTSLGAGDYVYDVVIEKSGEIHTVVKDKFVVVEGVRY